MSTVRRLKRHDTAELPRLLVQNAAGVAIDLTGATVVYTALETDGTGVLVLRGAATLEDQTLLPGQVYYPWQTGETGANIPRLVALTRGEFVTYEEEWEVTYPGGRKESFPVRRQDRTLVRITADLDNI